MGGISRYVVSLLPALAGEDAAARYTVFHSRKDDRSYVPPGAPHFARQNLWTPPHHRLERWALGVELMAHRLDLYHSPDFIPPAFGARRFVITVHDLNFLFYPEFLTAESRRYYADQIAWAVRRADHVLADSEHTRQDLIARLGAPADKITTVWLAADPVYRNAVLPQTVDDALARHDLPRGYILFVGTLEPRKNVPALLRVFRRLRDEGVITAPLVLVGGAGWLNESVYETMATLQLAPHVRQLSGLDGRTLAALYAGAGALALPSFYEGFGLPALEAMTVGCPVVTSDRGSLPEIVGDGGLLLPPDDEEAWCDALRRVLTDLPLRARLIQAGHAQADRFSWERTATETLAVYRQVVEG
jgi:glycosyltransferase involved in cell wall biosynthesis